MNQGSSARDATQTLPVFGFAPRSGTASKKRHTIAENALALLVRIIGTIIVV